MRVACRAEASWGRGCAALEFAPTSVPRFVHGRPEELHLAQKERIDEEREKLTQLQLETAAKALGAIARSLR